MDRNYALVFLMGILQQCPTGARCKDCPVVELDQKYGKKSAFHYLRSLSDAELKHFYEVHLACYHAKMDSNPTYFSSKLN